MKAKHGKTIIYISVLLTISIFFSACRSQKDITSSDGFTSSAVSASSQVSEVSSEEPIDNGIRLVISSPAKASVNVTEPSFTFSGTSDPSEPLTVNGIELPRGADGIFTYQAELKVGKNTFSFSHKGETKTYTVTYRYVIIESFSPSGAQTYPSGSTLIVNVKARKNSSVTATFSGQTVSLTRESSEAEESTDFVSYNGIFRLPDNNAQDVNLGKITYRAIHNGKSESFSSGNITCKKSDTIVDYDPNATPTGGKYINVGSGYVAEIAEYNAETFDGNVSDSAIADGSVDWSRPTNNYLPKGTLDYCSPSLLSYKDINYVTLRAGYRVYLERQDKPYDGKKAVVRQYIGSLPDHNEIAVASFQNNGSHTVLTLDTLWKAPFYFDILPQSYTNPSRQDYSVGAVTYNYIDITFCYATAFSGEIAVLDDDPLFSSAKVIENKNADGSAVRDYTLRLYLRKQGAFYGWDSYYNENGQLCFEFLNPKTVIKDDNGNTVNLNGAKILIDVGHGGKDSGALGIGAEKLSYCEKVANLKLSLEIKAQLEKLGADVYMTRSDDRTSSTDDKIKLLKEIKPDYCIAIHHNSNNSGKPNGFGAYYFNAFSKKASEFVLSQTSSLSLYKSHIFKWHYYYMCRTTNCPVVLTENGFMSNAYDFSNIKNPEKNTEKAKAIVNGILDYFNSVG